MQQFRRIKAGDLSVCSNAAQTQRRITMPKSRQKRKAPVQQFRRIKVGDLSVCSNAAQTQRRMTMPNSGQNRKAPVSAETNAVEQWLAIRTVEQWLAIRKEAGLKIDPETAEVHWNYAQALDPYGVYRDLSEKFQHFARSPGSDIWVHFLDLPAATCEALYKRMRPAFTVGSAGEPQRTDDDLNARIDALMAPKQ
jgi:hypothetical protein